jgi:hypothetical protein
MFYTDKAKERHFSAAIFSFTLSCLYPLFVLFMPVFAQTFFSLVGRHFMPFSFFTAWHRRVFLS